MDEIDTPQNRSNDDAEISKSSDENVSKNSHLLFLFLANVRIRVIMAKSPSHVFRNVITLTSKGLTPFRSNCHFVVASDILKYSLILCEKGHIIIIVKFFFSFFFFYILCASLIWYNLNLLVSFVRSFIQISAFMNAHLNDKLCSMLLHSIMKMLIFTIFFHISSAKCARQTLIYFDVRLFR